MCDSCEGYRQRQGEANRARARQASEDGEEGVLQASEGGEEGYLRILTCHTSVGSVLTLSTEMHARCVWSVVSQISTEPVYSALIRIGSSRAGRVAASSASALVAPRVRAIATRAGVSLRISVRSPATFNHYHPRALRT